MSPEGHPGHRNHTLNRTAFKVYRYVAGGILDDQDVTAAFTTAALAIGLRPAEVARLADAIGPRYRALVLLGAYGGLRMGELAGLRRGRVDLVRGTVDVAEIVVEVHGQLYTGSPKTRAGRRTVGLPRAVVEELAAHMGPVGPADAHVFTAEKGGCCEPPTSG